MNDKISIIIPVYNVEKYLAKCLDSVINQSYKNIEIICVNDGSTDNSLEILNEFAKRDDRIKVISKENGGQATARNLGLKQASGKYIGFVDADDYIDLQTYEKAYNAITQNNVDLVNWAVHVIDIDGSNKALDEIEQSVFVQLKDADISVDSSPCNKLYKANIISKNNIIFPEDVARSEDIEFVYEYLACSKTIYLLSDKLYYYTKHEGTTTTAKIPNKEIVLIGIFENIYNYYKKQNLLEERKYFLIYLFFDIMLGIYKHCKPKDYAKKEILELIKRIDNKKEFRDIYNIYIGHTLFAVYSTRIRIVFKILDIRISIKKKILRKFHLCK